MTITLRPVSTADEAFLLALYASTRAHELAQVPWNAEQKHTFLKMQFMAQKTSYAATHPNAQHDVIYRETEPVGRLYIDRAADRLHILDITIAERRRNEGVGSAVLRGIIQESEQAGKPVTIYVETFNPSMRLFERLGFRRAKVTDFQALLERLPAV